MGALRLAPDEMCPNFIASIFMTLASAPIMHVISASDVKSIAINKNISDVMLNESTTKSMIEIANRMGVPQHIAAKELGEFRTATTLKFFKKSKPLAKASVESMASKCYTVLLAHATTKVENPWAKDIEVSIEPKIDASKLAPEAVDKPALQAVEYKDGKVVGAHIAMITKKGFTLNAMIKHKKTGTITHELI